MSTTRSARPRSPGSRFPAIRAVRPGGAARDTFAVPLPPEWTRDALCAQTAPDAFFPEKGEATAPAKRICALCPVTAECLAYALANRERFGVWGGKSERERRAMTAHQRNHRRQPTEEAA